MKKGISIAIIAFMVVQFIFSTGTSKVNAMISGEIVPRIPSLVEAGFDNYTGNATTNSSVASDVGGTTFTINGFTAGLEYAVADAGYSSASDPADKCLKLVTNTSGKQVSFYGSGLNWADNIAIEMNFMAKDYKSNRTLVLAKYADTNNAINWLGRSTVLKNNGKISLNDHQSVSYNLNQWYSLMIMIDKTSTANFPNGSMKLYLDGQKIDECNLPPNYKKICYYWIFQAQTAATGTTSELCIDNFKVYQYNYLIPITSMEITSSQTEFAVGNSIQINTARLPENANENVIWESTNPEIASVDNAGKVLGIRPGNTIIRARTTVNSIISQIGINVQVPNRQWVSSSVQHPVSNLVEMFGANDRRKIQAETAESLTDAVASYMAMPEDQYINWVRNEIKNNWIDREKDTIAEVIARKMCMLYNLNVAKKEEYARRAALTLYEHSLKYYSVPLQQSGDLLYAPHLNIPGNSLYGYDLIYNSNVWADLGQEINPYMKDIIESWFRESALIYYRIYLDKLLLTNIVPYGIKLEVGAGLVLNDPDIIRNSIRQIDRLYSGRVFHSDGMWNEGTVDYHYQVLTNLSQALGLIQRYKDPDGYVDTQLGLQLDYNTDLTGRWPILQNAKKIGDIMVYPDGDKIPLHDSHYINPVENNIMNNKPKQELLKNIELWDFGYYGLVQGDTENAVHAGLLLPPLTGGMPYGGGHYHGDMLAMDLWGAGMEVFPDSGYMPLGGYRFFFMDARSHNVAWASSTNTNFNAGNMKWARSSVLAYDPGNTSSNKIKLIEASSPGPETDNIDMKRRLLMTVNLDGNRSYVVDMQRLKGGDTHELFLRASEEENVTMSTGFNLTDTGSANLEEYLKSIGKNTFGLKGLRKLSKAPKTASGENGFDFTWKGDVTGATVRTFMNGQSNDTLYFTQMPTLRRTQNDITKKDDYPNWHLSRMRNVTSEEITQYGAVYDVWKDGAQSSAIENVCWLKPDDGDPMTSIIKVTSANYVDYIYISNNTVRRSIEGITFSGSTAMVRKDKVNGGILSTYLYGEGGITTADINVTGTADVKLPITHTQGSLDGSIENVITVDGTIPSAARTEGNWALLELGDKSGKAMKITKIAEDNKVNVHSDVPFRIRPQGAERIYYPDIMMFKQGTTAEHNGDPLIIEGTSYLTIKTPMYKSFKVTGVSLKEDLVLLTEKNTYKLNCAVTPTEAGIKVVNYVSGNESVAKVDSNGVITAEGHGIADITVTTVDGGFSDKCIVIVIKSSDFCGGKWFGFAHGYWKEHCSEWIRTGYLPDKRVDEVFDIPSWLLKDGIFDLNKDGLSDTLLDVMNYKGGIGLSGKAQILLRGAVTALLNEALLGDKSTLFASEDELIDTVNSVLGKNNIAKFIELITRFNEYSGDLNE